MTRSLFLLLFVLGACARSHVIGQAPEMSPIEDGREYRAMMSDDIPLRLENGVTTLANEASLWTRNRGSLLGDRRAMQRGDIMTVVIEIDEKAEMSNTSARSRSGEEGMKVSAMFGIPQLLERKLPGGISFDPGVELGSSSEAKGQGSVSRNEKLTLRVAATVTQVQPNGVLAIEGHQEVRVNFEMRDLRVSGYVRPEDISRQNEITYDKIASARISYGGRGQIHEMQQPRYGQQMLDAMLPF